MKQTKKQNKKMLQKKKQQQQFNLNKPSRTYLIR